MLSYISTLLTWLLSFFQNIACIAKGRKRKKYKKHFKRPFKGRDHSKGG